MATAMLTVKKAGAIEPVSHQTALGKSGSDPQVSFVFPANETTLRSKLHGLMGAFSHAAVAASWSGPPKNYISGHSNLEVDEYWKPWPPVNAANLGLSTNVRFDAY
jgi:hypothetical protein